ncbi:hypothetical protein BDK51DRAFT_28261, partial [Blyttiomyces helicus]
LSKGGDVMEKEARALHRSRRTRAPLDDGQMPTSTNETLATWMTGRRTEERPARRNFKKKIDWTGEIEGRPTGTSSRTIPITQGPPATVRTTTTAWLSNKAGPTTFGLKLRPSFGHASRSRRTKEHTALGSIDQRNPLKLCAASYKMVMRRGMLVGDGDGWGGQEGGRERERERKDRCVGNSWFNCTAVGRLASDASFFFGFRGAELGDQQGTGTEVWGETIN